MAARRDRFNRPNLAGTNYFFPTKIGPQERKIISGDPRMHRLGGSGETFRKDIIFPLKPKVFPLSSPRKTSFYELPDFLNPALPTCGQRYKGTGRFGLRGNQKFL